MTANDFENVVSTKKTLEIKNISFMRSCRVTMQKTICDAERVNYVCVENNIKFSSQTMLRHTLRQNVTIYMDQWPFTIFDKIMKTLYTYSS